MALTRRSFLTGLLATTAVPAVAEPFSIEAPLFEVGEQGISYVGVQPIPPPPRMPMDVFLRCVDLAKRHSIPPIIFDGQEYYVFLEPDDDGSLWQPVNVPALVPE